MTPFLLIVGLDQMSERAEKMIAAFQLFDPERTGYVSTDAMTLLLSTLGKPLTAEETKEFITDCDDAGKIHYRKFVESVVFGPL